MSKIPTGLACVLLLSCSGEKTDNVSELDFTPAPTLNEAQLSGIAQQLSEDKSRIARAAYSGLKIEQGLDLESSTNLISSINLGLFPDLTRIDQTHAVAKDWTLINLADLTNLPLFPDGATVHGNKTINGVLDCSAGGNMIVQSTQLDGQQSALQSPDATRAYYHFSIEYLNCSTTQSTLVFDGHVDLYYSIKSVSYNPNFELIDFIYATSSNSKNAVAQRYGDMVHIYNKLRVRNEDRTLQVEGSLRWNNPEVCGQNGLKQLTAHIINLENGESILFDDMLMGWRRLVGQSCVRDLQKMTYYHGLLHHSTYGSIRIVTPDINYPNNHQYPIYSTRYPSGYDYTPFAEISVFSKNTKTHVSDLILFNTNNILEGRKISFSLYDAYGKRSHAHQLSSTMFVKGGLLDAEDDDKDGMWNSWESAAGLDKNYPQDSFEDEDFDFVTNLEEFQTGGDPLLYENTGFGLDMSFTPSSDYGIGYYDDNQTIRVTLYIDKGYLQNNGWNDPEFTFDADYLVLTADTDGVWNPESDKCIVNRKDNALHCSSSNPLSFNGGFLPANRGLVTITATLKQYEYDYNSDNNVIRFVVEY